MFVALADGSLLVEEGDAEVATLASAAVELERPYRAEVVPRGDGLCAVGAREIETVELTGVDPVGTELVVSWDGVDRRLLRDGLPVDGREEELERLGQARFAAYVVTARRLARTTWEVDVSPL